MMMTTTTRDATVVDTYAKLEPAALSWHIDESPSATTVELSGEIDETADFAGLRRRLRGPVVFVLAGVRRVNSCGVREWIEFVRGLDSVTFVACSTAFVAQLNTIYNFRGPAKVRSFFAPYRCTRCGREEEKLLLVATHFPGRSRKPPEFGCDRCSAPMELDDVPVRYLSFLDG